MDHSGIGAALEGAAKVYFLAARRTGRTAALIESLKDGDRVVFASPVAAREFENRCREADKRIDTVVLSVDRAYEYLARKRPKGRLVFDHGWVEDYYLASLRRSAEFIDRMQLELSGDKEPPIDVRIDRRWDMPGSGL